MQKHLITLIAARPFIVPYHLRSKLSAVNTSNGASAKVSDQITRESAAMEFTAGPTQGRRMVPDLKAWSFKLW